MFSEEYIREDKIVDRTEEEINKDLYQDLENSKRILNNLYENLNFVSNDLIDYYTYKIKAEEAKYRFFIK